jgi:DNA helicase II / ATP-dependent DNA helicase PcrA
LLDKPSGHIDRIGPYEGIFQAVTVQPSVSVPVESPATASTVEHRVQGPPGTGKTTWLGEQVRRACQSYGSESILIASLTRAAAAEIAGRDLPLDRHQIGTLHSHALRALGWPLDRLAETPRAIREWNCAVSEAWCLSGEAADVDDPLDHKGGAAAGDRLLEIVGTCRHRMLDRREWPIEAAHFAAEWEAWKAETERYDFTDMIASAVTGVDTAPGNPALLFVDEAQDCSALELALVRRWSAAAQRLVICGDTDQAIYTWRGADPNAFHSPPLPDDRYRTLAQSFRVPSEVHRAAVGWISQVVGRRPVTYRPRPGATGCVRELPARYLAPDNRLLDDLEEQLDQPGSDPATGRRRVMLLATCSYMLEPLVQALRERSLPFWNPYRVRAGRWNPLRATTRDRLLAFLRPDPRVWGNAARMWSLRDLQLWARDLRAEFYVRGQKAKLAEVAATDEVPIDFDVVLTYLTEPAATAAFHLDLDWWRGAQTKAGQTSGVEWATDIARRRGGRALREEPRVVVGTIHSVKGGEADSVYVWPDLSNQGWQTWESDEASIRRLFYVAMTRAREELVLLSPSSARAVTLT